MQRFKYMLKQAFKNLGKNKWYTLASVGTMTACLFLFGIFYILAQNISHMILHAEETMTVTVLFEQGISEADRNHLETQILERSEVKNLVYISPEEAWEKFKTEIFKDHEELAETFKDDNPLADSESFEITTKEIEQQTELVEWLESLPGVRQVNSAEYAVKTLEAVNSMVSMISGGMITILLLVSLFLISITVSVGIFMRKEEISILRMLGANDYFIRGPYVCEGLMLGFLGGIVPLGILYIVYGNVMEYLLTKFEGLAGILAFLSAGEIFMVLVPTILAFGIGIGFVGSFITVRRYLRG